MQESSMPMLLAWYWTSDDVTRCACLEGNHLRRESRQRMCTKPGLLPCSSSSCSRAPTIWTSSTQSLAGLLEVSHA